MTSFSAKYYRDYDPQFVGMPTHLDKDAPSSDKKIRKNKASSTKASDIGKEYANLSVVRPSQKRPIGNKNSEIGKVYSNLSVRPPKAQQRL